MPEMKQTLPDDEIQGADRPWIFGLLIAPSAVIANGIVQGGVLGYLLTQHGMKIDEVSHWIGVLALPTSLYFLYSPLTDFLVKRRTWLMIASFTAAALMLLAFSQKDIAAHAPLRLILLSGCLSQLVVACCGGVMGTISSVQSRKAASGYYQAGSMTFGALATWLLIRESSRVSGMALGFMAATMIGVPGLAALLAPAQPQVQASGLLGTLKVLGSECKATFARWDAIPYLLFVLLPAGTGSAIGLLPGVARFYGVGGDQVAWVNGLLGALAIALGSMMTAVLSPKHSLPETALFGYSVNALLFGVMALGPVRPWNYFAGTICYLFTTGWCYSLGTAVVLEFLGNSGKSGSGRYSFINGLLNVPVLLMIVVDGWGAARWGARGLAATECVAALACCIPMMIYVRLRPLRPTVIATMQMDASAEASA